MGKDPAFLFYPSDFLSGTMLMTDEQAGKYMRLLCYEFLNGRLIKEDMIKICKEEDKDIFKHFQVDENGLYFNNRLEQEKTKRAEYSEGRRRNRESKQKTHVEDPPNTKDVKNNLFHEHMENENTNGDVNEEIDSTSIEIIEYLNSKAGTNFEVTEETKAVIRARIDEGYTTRDFYTVIDNKALKWKNDSNLVTHVTPSDLFNKSFGKYLN